MSHEQILEYFNRRIDAYQASKSNYIKRNMAEQSEVSKNRGAVEVQAPGEKGFTFGFSCDRVEDMFALPRIKKKR